MANVIIYDPASTPIANKVVRYVRSVQESDYADTPNVLINHDASGDNPEVTALLAASVPMSRWKVNGSHVEAFGQDDDLAIAAAQIVSDVEIAPDFESQRKRSKASKELSLALARWSELDQAGINAVVKHIATILS